MHASTTPIPSCADLLNEAEATLRAAGVSTPRLDAEVLLATALKIDRALLYSRFRDTVSEHGRSVFAPMLERRRRREPVAYITGVREFWSLPFHVTPAVLVPRPESELLVETVIGLVAKSRQPELTIWDAGTGSGCLAVALARELQRVRIVASDVSSAALEVARRNALTQQVADRIHFACADLDDGLRPAHRFDVVISNPPYVSTSEPMSPELAWEPMHALAAGTDGLQVIRRLLPQAAGRLREGGFVVMEMGFDQEEAVRGLAAGTGLVDLSVRADYAGLPRVLIGRAGRRANG